MMRIVEALEGKGFRVPLTKAEVELAEKLATIARQVSQFTLCFLGFMIFTALSIPFYCYLIPAEGTWSRLIQESS